MNHIIECAYVSEYRLLLTFSDGSRKIVDMMPYLKGEIFEPLKDVNVFKTVRLNEVFHTIEWPNGADMCPDVLYEIGTEISKTA